jgi:ParB family chromosome partitioning protein
LRFFEEEDDGDLAGRPGKRGRWERDWIRCCRAYGGTCTGRAGSKKKPNRSEAGKPMEIPIGEIDRNPFQTRMHFDEKLIAELAESIAANGVVQPILVRPLPNGRYQLIAGERRWLASQKAGKATIPAVVRQVSDEQAMEITIIENLQRADLNPIEQARAYERLGREFGMTQEQMAHRTGKDRASVGII